MMNRTVTMTMEDSKFIREKVMAHNKWFEESIPMIASENLMSPLAKEMLISDFADRYAEGLPGKRYYQGNIYVDEVELKAIELAKIAARQRRHLLLVGPPGTGKSMIARALSMNLPKPSHEVRVVKNPENPERPFLEILDAEEVEREEGLKAESVGILLTPQESPGNVAEHLGYKCKSCGRFSLPSDITCPHCSQSKMDGMNRSNPFQDILGGVLEVAMPQVTAGKEKVHTTRNRDGVDEVVIFERAGDKIRMLDQKAIDKRNELQRTSSEKVLVKLRRDPFVLATGASETELLGDVRHDPYGGHEKLGSPAYERIVAGSIHEAHEGVLFIDEEYTLTAKTENDFGFEAVDTILKSMEDNRDDLVVIVAGYIDLMEDFIDSNPGLRSRFN